MAALQARFKGNSSPVHRRSSTDRTNYTKTLLAVPIRAIRERIRKRSVVLINKLIPGATRTRHRQTIRVLASSTMRAPWAKELTTLVSTIQWSHSLTSTSNLRTSRRSSTVSWIQLCRLFGTVSRLMKRWKRWKNGGSKRLLTLAETSERKTFVIGRSTTLWRTYKHFLKKHSRAMMFYKNR